MARHVEPLNRGLVTIRDPGLLKEGELSFIRNAIYLPGSNALQRARGRTAFGTATASAVDVAGLRDMTFDNGDHYLLAHVSASYVTAVVGDTGTFGLLAAGVGIGTQLEVAQFRNRYYLFNGTSAVSEEIGTNLVVYLSATAAGTPPSTRTHGMRAVVEAPNVVTAGGGAFSQTVTGYYEYWTTEVARITQDGAQQTLESAFSSDSGPTTVLVSSTAIVPTIQQPTRRNPITTHWRIYRSPKKEKAGDVKFPSGFSFAEMSTGASAHADSSATNSASGLPTLFNSGNYFAGFVSASSMATDNGVYASGTVSPFAELVSQGTYNYSIPSFTGSIGGIIVEIQGYVSSGAAPVAVTVALGKRASTGNWVYVLDPDRDGKPTNKPLMAAKSGLITSTNSASPTTLSLGSSTDKWFASSFYKLVDTDFDANLMVVVTVSSPSHSVGIDYVKITVNHSVTADTNIPFPSVVYTFSDVVSQVAKNMPAPSSTTGTIFQDSMVVNDVSNPALIRWSFPGDPEAFPPTYFLDFETRENDQVRFIGVVNNRLIVGLDSSLWRVNYLPSERDATFDRGNAVEAITRNYGIVNPMCACVFSTDGAQERLAFVSNQGVHATDGFSLETYSDGLDWRGDRDGIGVAPTGTLLGVPIYAPYTLINDRERQELLFYFRNASASEPPGHGNTGSRYWCLHFQYNELVDGKPRVAGMVTVENQVEGTRAAPKSAWAVSRGRGQTDVYIGFGTAVSATSVTAGAGQVWRENGTDLSSGYPVMTFATRRMFLAGMGREWRLGEVYGYAGLVTWSGAAPVVAYSLSNAKTNSAINDNAGEKSYTFSTSSPTQTPHRVVFSAMCEGAVITATITGDCAYSEEQLVIDGDDFGVEDSGL